jgi:site-specific DNA recombinase
MNKLRYIAYLRKSTEDEERQVLSKAAQKDNIIKCFPDLQIVEWFDDSKSAFKPNQRISFQKMLDRIDAGKADGIVAWHPDRISRNEVDASAITWRIRQNIIKDLKFASFSFDNSPEGMMMLQMTMSQSQYFSAKLSKDVRRGLAKKIQMGGITGVAPEGYLNNKAEKTIEPDPERFPLIRKAFDIFLTGEYSVSEVLRILNNDWGYTTIKRNKVGGGPINRSSMYNLFRNPRYAGVVPDPYDIGTTHKSSFTPMITPEEYDRVQSLLGKSGKPRLCASKTFALKGFIRCGECGCMVTAETKKKILANGTINYYTYYHCTRKRPCSQRGSVKEEELFHQVERLLDGYQISPKLHEWGMKALKELADKEIAARDNIQVMQHKSISTIQAQLDKLLDMATKDLITSSEYKTKSLALKNALQNRQEEQTATSHRVKNWYEFVGNALETLTDVNEKFVKGDLRDKRNIMLTVGQNPVLVDGKLCITPNEWLLPLFNGAKSVLSELEKVRTNPHKIQKDSEESVYQSWLGMRDSNPRCQDQNLVPYHLANPQY